MAERRMFAKTIVTSDAFLDMPMSARCLYFTLGMFADDDGFVNNPKSILRQIGASDDDMRVLLSKKFVLSFESGVIVIKHWRINNYLRNDRYHATTYQEEKQMLSIDSNGAYSEATCRTGIPVVDQRYTENSIDKNSIGESIAPTLDMIKEYCEKRKSDVDAERFYNYYSARGWKMNHDIKMTDWKAALRAWERKKDGDPDAKQKILDDLKARKQKLIDEGASKEDLQNIELEIISVEDSIGGSAC